MLPAGGFDGGAGQPPAGSGPGAGNQVNTFRIDERADDCGQQADARKGEKRAEKKEGSQHGISHSQYMEYVSL